MRESSLVSMAVFLLASVLLRSSYLIDVIDFQIKDLFFSAFLGCYYLVSEFRDSVKNKSFCKLQIEF